MKMLTCGLRLHQLRRAAIPSCQQEQMKWCLRSCKTRFSRRSDCPQLGQLFELGGRCIASTICLRMQETAEQLTLCTHLYICLIPAPERFCTCSTCMLPLPLVFERPLGCPGCSAVAYANIFYISGWRRLQLCSRSSW